MIDNFGVRAEKIEVFYNAVKEYAIENPGLQRDKILYVGNMWSSKGVDTLLEAMPAVLEVYPEIKLSLIGGSLKGSRIKQLQKKSAELKIAANVTFLGSQSKERVLNEFAGAYLAVVPSIVEAFGFVVIESFSVKTPVIGANTSGIAEIIRNGKDGFLFQPGNPVDLSSKILKLLQNEELREEFSQNCYERFRDEFEVGCATTIVREKLKNILASKD